MHGIEEVYVIICLIWEGLWKFGQKISLTELISFINKRAGLCMEFGRKISLAELINFINKRYIFL